MKKYVSIFRIVLLLSVGLGIILSIIFAMLDKDGKYTFEGLTNWYLWISMSPSFTAIVLLIVGYIKEERITILLGLIFSYLAAAANLAIIVVGVKKLWEAGAMFGLLTCFSIVWGTLTAIIIIVSASILLGPTIKIRNRDNS